MEEGGKMGKEEGGGGKGVPKYAITPAAKITVLLISDYNSSFQGSRPCPIDFLRKNTWE